jgi:GDSL-like Lipase/Acylhydrolase
MTLIHWSRGLSGLFTDAADWSTGTVPGAGDDVEIIARSRSPYTVTSYGNQTIETLEASSRVTLAVNSGTFFIIGGTGTGSNEGTISVANGAALEVGGLFRNTGTISLNSTGGAASLLIYGNVALTGGGTVTLNPDGDDIIEGALVKRIGLFPPFQLPFLRFFPFFLFPASPRLTNADLIEGAGTIGGRNLSLVNDGTIIGNSTLAAMTLDTGSQPITNFGVVDGATAPGVVIVSNVSNYGLIEAEGDGANLTLDGTVTQFITGTILTSSINAHVGLAAATVVGGTVEPGRGGFVESVAGSGQSMIQNAVIFGTGALEANQHSELIISSGSIASNVGLMSNGIGSVLDVATTVGANSAALNGGEIEFSDPAAANVTFAPGLVGTLKIDDSFTGTVSGLTGQVPQTFSNLFVFGDSTVDSGALQYLSPDLPSPPNPGLTDRLANALAAGGTDSPVGVGLMNPQILAADFGLTANTAYTTGGVVGGGGTNYAISGALDAADTGNLSEGGNDPGNGGISNIDQGQTSPNPALLSTVAQLQTYLDSVGGKADPSAIYLISSGANDYSYAVKTFVTSNGTAEPAYQQAYMTAQADTLAAEIEQLAADGAEHIIVNPIINNQPLSVAYSTELYSDLDQSGIAYTKSDVHAMVQDVLADPTAYGFTSTTVEPGVVGTQTQSALIEPDTVNGLAGWGLWGADTTTPDSNVPLNQQYAYLSSPDAEQTHFFSDDGHLSAAGQQIQANLDYNLIADDAIDLTSLAYIYGTTGASFSGNATSGTLAVTNGTQSVNIALLGNYLASTFMTASDGTGGTLVMDASSPSQVPVLAVSHTSH